MRRGSVIRARIPPSREDRQIVMCLARTCAAKMLQLAIGARTPHKREVQHDFRVASSSLPSLLILATATLTTSGAVRCPDFWSHVPGPGPRTPGSDDHYSDYVWIIGAKCQGRFWGVPFC